MTPITEMTLGQRVMLTVAIVLVILFALALGGYFTGGWDDAGAQTLPPSRYDERIIDLDRRALDEAYRDQITHLFQVWMKDEHDQPRRALVGAQQARKAYIGAMTEIDKKDPRLK